MNQENRTVVVKSSKKKKRIISIIILIIIILLIILGLYKCGSGDDETNGSDIIIGAGVKEGALDSGEDSDVGNESNGKGIMRVKLNGRPTFGDGAGEGNLNIENPPENALYMKVEIRLNGSDEVIYESGAIPPNHYIDNDKLAKVLAKGEYGATAYVTLFDPDNPDTQYNSANFDMIITIKN